MSTRFHHLTFLTLGLKPVRSLTRSMLPRKPRDRPTHAIRYRSLSESKSSDPISCERLLGSTREPCGSGLVADDNAKGLEIKARFDLGRSFEANRLESLLNPERAGMGRLDAPD